MSIIQKKIHNQLCDRECEQSNVTVSTGNVDVVTVVENNYAVVTVSCSCFSFSLDPKSRPKNK